MKLLDNYYKIVDTTEASGATVFRVELLPGCKVYEGHFPGNPVSPGACNMQMIKELAERISGQPLHIASIKQCRLMAVVSPQDTPSLAVTATVVPTEQGFTVTATIAAADTVCLTFKGEMTA